MVFYPASILLSVLLSQEDNEQKFLSIFGLFGFRVKTIVHQSGIRIKLIKMSINCLLISCFMKVVLILFHPEDSVNVICYLILFITYDYEAIYYHIGSIWDSG